jgi:hypothetical protein
VERKLIATQHRAGVPEGSADRPRASEHDPDQENGMDGTVTAGGKGLPYLRDSYFPAVTDQVIAALQSVRSGETYAEPRTTASAA